MKICFTTELSLTRKLPFRLRFYSCRFMLQKAWEYSRNISSIYAWDSPLDILNSCHHLRGIISSLIIVQCKSGSILTHKCVLNVTAIWVRHKVNTDCACVSSFKLSFCLIAVYVDVFLLMFTHGFPPFLLLSFLPPPKKPPGRWIGYAKFIFRYDWLCFQVVMWWAGAAASVYSCCTHSVPRIDSRSTRTLTRIKTEWEKIKLDIFCLTSLLHLVPGHSSTFVMHKH